MRKLSSLQSAAVLGRLGHDKRDRLRYDPEPLDHGKSGGLRQNCFYLKQRRRPRTEWFCKFTDT